MADSDLTPDDEATLAIDEMSVALDMARGDRKRKRQHACDVSHVCRAKYLLSGDDSELRGTAIDLCEQTIKANEETCKALALLGQPVVTTSGPMHIPIATVEDNARELVFDRPGVPLCSRGVDCMAHMVPGPVKGPLGVYQGPGADPEGTECLLCIRHGLCMLVAMHHNNNSHVPVGIIPPFCNPVDTHGGYRSSFCAVTPNDMDIISGAVYICGAPVGMKKIYNPYAQTWQIDESVAIFGAPGGNHFFF